MGNCTSYIRYRTLLANKFSFKPTQSCLLNRMEIVTERQKSTRKVSLPFSKIASIFGKRLGKWCDEVFVVRKCINLRGTTKSKKSHAMCGSLDELVWFCSVLLEQDACLTWYLACFCPWSWVRLASSIAPFFFSRVNLLLSAAARQSYRVLSTESTRFYRTPSPKRVSCNNDGDLFWPKRASGHEPCDKWKSSCLQSGRARA